MITQIRKYFPIYDSSPNLATFLSFSIGIFMLGLLLSLSSYLFTNANIAKADETTWTPPTGKSILEVHIANNGMVFLQGAKVESISGNDLVVSTSWNALKLKWTIHTDESYYGKRHFGTNFYDSKGNRLSLNDIHLGSIISINGDLDTNSDEPNVAAETIRTSN